MILELKFTTPKEAQTIANILSATYEKAYKAKSIPKGVSIEDYVNYRDRCREVLNAIHAIGQPRLF